MWEFVLHRFQNDVFIFHNMRQELHARLSRRCATRRQDGKPTFITDTAFAEADFQKQLSPSGSTACRGE